MRERLSSAKKRLSRMAISPVVARSFFYGHRASIFVIAATLVVITTLGFITVRAITGGLNNKGSEQNAMTTSHEKTANGSSVTTSTTSTNDPVKTETKSEISANSSEGAKASMSVNGQPIDIPKNGSVSRTFSDENGTTHVNVSTNTDSTGTGISSNVSHTTLNSSTNTYSQNVSISSDTSTSSH